MKRNVNIWLLLVSLAMLFLPVTANAAPVKNVIVLMMDGTGSTHTTLARWYKGAPLALDEMIAGGVRTYSAESLISDSAPAATAFATGHKSNTKFIGVLPATVTIPGATETGERYKPVATVLEGAKLAGKATGLVATSNIQHASPASFSAHWPDRGNYNEITEQQVYENIDVVFGAGKPYLLPREMGGKRTDGENMYEVLKSRGYAIVQNREELAGLKAGRVWGLFGDEDLAYEFDRAAQEPRQPSLPEMTRKAIELLSQNEKGFFLFVEGSKVDWASHANDPIGVISEVLAFDDAVKAALEFAKKDGQTLVLAFADHSNGGMSIGNKATDKNYDRLPFSAVVDPLKKALLTGEGLEKMLEQDLSEGNIRLTVLQYYGIEDLTAEEVAAIQKAKKGALNYVVGPIISKRAAIGWTTVGHTGEDLFLYAYGPNHPSGLIDNTDIAKIVARNLGFELAKVDGMLFVEATEAFGKIGARVSVDRSDAANPMLVVQKGLLKAEIPFSKNIVKVNGKVHSVAGITVFAPNIGKIYVPQQAVDIVKSVYTEQ